MLLLPNEVRPTKEFQFPFRPRKLDESYTMTLISAIKKSNLDFCIASTSKVWPLGRHPNKDVTLVEFKCPLTSYRSQIILELLKKFRARPQSFGRVKIILRDQKKIQGQTKNFWSGPNIFVLEEKRLFIAKFYCLTHDQMFWSDPTGPKKFWNYRRPGQKFIRFF